MAVLVIEDLVSRKWLTEIVSVEETQVELAFTDPSSPRACSTWSSSCHGDGRVDLTVDDQTRPILLAVSDNGSQMTSGSTREFMALCAIAQHVGRPGTPTDQAWVESLNGRLKAEYPHLLAIRDPTTLRAELAVAREHYNGVRLHQGVGYVTPNDEHDGRAEAIRKQRRPDSNRPDYAGLPGTVGTGTINPSRTPTMLANTTRSCIAKSETRH